MVTYHLSKNLSPHTFLVFMENHGFENFSPHTFFDIYGKATSVLSDVAHGFRTFLISLVLPTPHLLSSTTPQKKPQNNDALGREVGC